MASVTHDQHQQLDAIREARQERLNELELQAARFGYRTPPEIANEIRQLKADLGLVEAVGQPDVSEELLQLLGRFAQRRATDDLVLRMQQSIREIERSVQMLWYAYFGLVAALIFALALYVGKVYL
jgi:hypothetical protein